LPPDASARLLAAHQAGRSEEDLRRILGEALGHVYFRDHGRRAQDLDVEINDVDYLELDLGG
jgi:hypothetical protein